MPSTASWKPWNLGTETAKTLGFSARRGEQPLARPAEAGIVEARRRAYGPPRIPRLGEGATGLF
jgi:hypothetical protein